MAAFSYNQVFARDRSTHSLPIDLDVNDLVNHIIQQESALTDSVIP